MRKILLAFLFGTALVSSAFAQSNVIVNYRSSTSQTTQVSSTNPLPVTGSFSATTTGFAPSLSYSTCTATVSACSSTALPTNTGSVILFNSGTTTVSCTLASGAATAVASELQIPASSGLPLATVYASTTYDHFSCIDQTGSTSNVVIASGGSGLPTGWGGGGSGGGGGAITAASGSYSSGALASGSIASGAMVDLGSQGDTACTTDNGSCSAIALIKRTNQDITTLNTTASSPIVGLSGSSQSSSNPMGYVNINQTTPGTTNGAAIVGINGATALAGNGATGTGSLRVTVASDNTPFATKVDQTTPGSTNGVMPSITNAVWGTTSAMTGTTSTQLIAATSSKVTYVTSLSCVNSHATVGTFVTIQDGSGGTTLGTVAAAAVFGGEVLTAGGVPLFPPTTSGNGVFVADVTTGANVICTAAGFHS